MTMGQPEVAAAHFALGAMQCRYCSAGALLVVILCEGCNPVMTAPPAAVSTTPVSQPAASATQPDHAPATQEDSVSSANLPGTKIEPPALEAPLPEPTPSPVDAVDPRIPDALREPVAALRALGATIEFGAGDRIIAIDLEDRPATDADLASIAMFQELKSLNLSGTKITDAGLKSLAENSKLKFLYLFQVPVTDAGLSELVALSRLEVLCLDQTEITDAGLETLRELTRLEKLHVHSRRPITDAGLLALKGHRRLFELRVGGPGLTESGLAALQTALPNCTIVFDPAAEAAKE